MIDLPREMSVVCVMNEDVLVSRRPRPRECTVNEERTEKEDHQRNSLHGE